MEVKSKLIKKSPGFLLWQASNLWQRKQKLALKSLELTHVQFILLIHIFYLEQEIENLSQSVLAVKAHTDPMMTSQVVRVLIDKGLVSRQDNPNDVRAFRLQTTFKGRDIANKALKIVEEVDRKFFDKIDDPDLFLKNLEILFI